MSSPTFTFSNFYTNKIDNLTLSEAFEIHYQLNPQFTKWYDYKDELQQKTMKSHDIAHIIFGCNTSLTGEMRVELWTLFSNNLPKGEYMKLVKNSSINKEPFAILKQIGYFKVLFVFIVNLWRIPYILYLSSKLNKKWPFFAEEQFMNTKIRSIRSEYGIKV